MRIRRALMVGLLAAVMAIPAVGEGSAPANPTCDITGDGFADLVLGIPNADGNQPTEAGSGAILVVPGGPTGPDAQRSWKVTQDASGVPDRNEPDDAFGSAVVCADIDNDGFGDVAVGIPGERVGGRVSAGAVAVMYGAPTGFDPHRHERWTPRKPGVIGDAASAARFGEAMAAGDFDADGYRDLAIASPGIGIVHVLYGSATGLTARDTVVDAGDLDAADGGFGTSLTAGDFDGDGSDDLAIAAPAQTPAGAVTIVWGAPGGTHLTESRTIDFATPGIRGAPKPESALGAALAAADFDGDGRDDLAMGAPGYRYAGNDGAGVVLVLFGSKSRLGSRDRLVSSVAPTRSAAFGAALAAGDFNGDGIADFAAGAPTDDGRAPYAGRVETRYGGPNATFVDGEVLLGATLGAAFGSELARTTAPTGHADDLWIAAPYARVAGVSEAGALTYAPGSSTGLADVVQIDRTTRGIAGPAATGEQFGRIDGSAHRADHPAMFLQVVDRSAWSERASINSRMARHSISEITIHHLGGSSSATGVTRFRVAQNWHIDGLGWGDIAYHYIVAKDGKVYAARDSQWAGDTTTDYDPEGHLLVVAEGNFDEDIPTETQLEALAATVAWAVEEWDVPLNAVSGHRDHAATACPGEHLYPYVASGELVTDVRTLLDAGGVWIIPAD